MIAILSRSYHTKYTLGTLILFDGADVVLNIKTIELPYLDNQRNISCIPPGSYDVERYYSDKRGGIFHVKNVPDRSAIMIHAGNYAAGDKLDTKGCILPGTTFADINNDGYLDITNSGRALSMLIEAGLQGFQLIIL